MSPDPMHLDFGKYAPFIWTAYGLSAGVIAALVFSSLAFARKWRRQAEQGQDKL